MQTDTGCLCAKGFSGDPASGTGDGLQVWVHTFIATANPEMIHIARTASEHAQRSSGRMTSRVAMTPLAHARVVAAAAIQVLPRMRSNRWEQQFFAPQTKNER